MKTRSLHEFVRSLCNQEEGGEAPDSAGGGGEGHNGRKDEDGEDCDVVIQAENGVEVREGWSSNNREIVLSNIYIYIILTTL